MEIDLHITNRCNLRCLHCVYSSGDIKMDDMTIDIVKELIDDFKAMNVKEIHLTGGEPLLNHQIYDIISIFHKNNFKTRIQSNGFLLNEAIVSKLIDSGLDQILISIDGMKDSHNYFRKNEKSFDLALAAVQICVSKKLYTRVNTVVHKKNLLDIPNLIELTSKLNISQHSFFYLTPIGRGKELKDKLLNFDEWEKIYNNITKIAKSIKFQDKIKIQKVFQKKVYIKDFDVCRKDNCLIMSNGDVYSCVLLLDSEYIMGNIYKSKLLDIWQNSKTWEKLSLPRKKICKNKLCGGGCPGISFLTKGSIEECAPLCRPDINLISSCVREYIKIY